MNKIAIGVYVLLSFKFITSVNVFQMTYNVNGYFANCKKNEENAKKTEPGNKEMTVDQFATKMAEQVKLSKKDKPAGFYDLLVFNIQETKNAGGFKNAVLSGLKTVSYDLEWDKIKDAKTKFQSNKLDGPSKELIEKDKGVHFGLGLFFLVLMEKLNDENTEYDCTYGHVFQYLATVVCVRKKPVNSFLFTVTMLKELHYGTFGDKKNVFTFGFKGGFTIAIDFIENQIKASILVTNMHLTPRDLIERRSQFFSTFKELFIIESEKKLVENSQRYILNVPIVHFFTGDFNARQFSNFKKDETLKSSKSLDKKSEYLEPCFKKVIEDLDVSPFKPEKTITLSAKVDSKMTTTQPILCSKIREINLRFDEYIDFFSNRQNLLNSIINSIKLDIQRSNIQFNSFSQIFEAPINFWPSYSYDKKKKIPKKNKVVSFTDRIFWALGSTGILNAEKSRYLKCESFFYDSNIFDFLSDHAAVFGGYSISSPIEFNGNNPFESLVNDSKVRAIYKNDKIKNEISEFQTEITLKEYLADLEKEGQSSSPGLNYSYLPQVLRNNRRNLKKKENDLKKSHPISHITSSQLVVLEKILLI